MGFRVAADVVVLTHFSFVLFVVLGGLLTLHRRWWAWLHLPAAVWGALIEFAGWICPLTPLERWLRVQAGEGGYEGGFIQHYIVSVLYPAGLTRSVQIGLGLAVVILNLAIYWTIFIRKRRGD